MSNKKDNKLFFKLEVFEGPLDLLLHLIEKNKVNIYDIPIVEVTNQYMDYLDKMDDYDLDISSEFLVMASNLLYIKSRMLLPKVEEEKDEEDPRKELVDKLIQYKKYKQISEVLYKRSEKYMGMYYKKPDDIIKQIEHSYSLAPISSKKLIKAFKRLILKKQRILPPSKESFDNIVQPVKVTIEEKTKEIIDSFKNKDKISFNNLFIYDKTKIDLIVKFIALLELIKDQKVIVTTDYNGQIILVFNI